MSDGGSGLLDDLQALLDRGDGAQALSLARQQVAASPQDATASRALSQVLAAAGEAAEALREAKRACELAPDDPRSWSGLGRVLALDGRHADAAQCFQETLQIDPRHADGWHNLGTALKKLGDRQGAFDALKQALLLDDRRAETWLNLGSLLVDAGQFEDAIECYERAAQHDPGLSGARSRLAQQYSVQGKVQRAETLFRESLGLDPDHVDGWFGLGRTLEDLGQAEGALGCYLQVLQRKPGHAQALGQYLALLRGEAEPALLQRARQAVSDHSTLEEARALVGYGLAKYHDRRQEHALAAAAGLAANQARRTRAGPLDRPALSARVDAIIGTCTAEFFRSRRHHGLGTDQPVFIVGLPRSGTTLTEQILSAHPLLHGAGELPELGRIAAAGVGAEQEPWQAATLLGVEQSREQAQKYLAALRDSAPRGLLRISDKSPLNFFNLALAAVLFPHARIVHCRRDARDNALSIWMENFSPDQRYATDFDDLAFFTAQYRRLMAHWREHLPLPMLELQYEETVADLEGQARRLVEFLGAPWDSRCLQFHQSGRAVQTPSRWQVRQPIYTQSVARWKAYEPSLPSLAQAFASL